MLTFSSNRDPSGVSSPGVTASHDSGQGTGFASTSRISGDEFDGTWQSVLTVDQVAAAGEWSVSLFPLRDTLGNSGSFGPSNQFNRVFTVGVVAAPTIAIEGAATITLDVGETYS
jgi:serine protease